jgi:hypothetical protein
MKRKKEQNPNKGYEEVPVERQGWKELRIKCFKAMEFKIC